MANDKKMLYKNKAFFSIISDFSVSDTMVSCFRLFLTLALDTLILVSQCIFLVLFLEQDSCRILDLGNWKHSCHRSPSLALQELFPMMTLTSDSLTFPLVSSMTFLVLYHERILDTLIFRLAFSKPSLALSRERISGNLISQFSRIFVEHFQIFVEHFQMKNLVSVSCLRSLVFCLRNSVSCLRSLAFLSTHVLVFQRFVVIFLQDSQSYFHLFFPEVVEFSLGCCP